MRALACALLVVVAACDKKAAAPATATGHVDGGAATVSALTAEKRAQAREVVEQNCQMCHALDLVQSQRLGKTAWEKELKKMVGWGAPVPPEEVAGVVAVLADEYGVDVPPAPPPTVSAADVLASVAIDEPPPGGDVKHGAAVYQIACASCHGVGAVGGPIGPALVDRPILHRAHDFETIVRTGRLRMPAVPLDAATMRDLFAYLRAAHG